MRILIASRQALDTLFPMATQAHLTLSSSNMKTGPIPVSITEEKSCPASCPLKSKGCYAKVGPLLIHWRQVSEHIRGIPWGEFYKAVSRLPRNQFWRHNQAGDLPGHGQNINAIEFAQLVKANQGKRGFTYTHKHTRNDGSIHAENVAQIKAANEKGFTVNLSANSLAHADKLADLNAGPVVTILPRDCKENTVTPAGRKVVICPATYREYTTCATCQLCQKQRGAIVGFPAHGTSAKTASAIASS